MIDKLKRVLTVLPKLIFTLVYNLLDDIFIVAGVVLMYMTTNRLSNIAANYFLAATLLAIGVLMLIRRR